MIKTCRSRSKRCIAFQTPLQSKLILLSFLILGAMNNYISNTHFVLIHDSLGKEASQPDLLLQVFHVRLLVKCIRLHVLEETPETRKVRTK